MDTMLEIAKRVDDFMMERSPVHDTMRRLAQTLGDLGIPFAIAEAMAANAHGHRRTTAAVDVLVRREDLIRFEDRWIGARGGAGVATWSHSLRTEQPNQRPAYAGVLGKSFPPRGVEFTQRRSFSNLHREMGREFRVEGGGQ